MFPLSPITVIYTVASSHKAGVPLSQSQRLHEKLLAAGAQSELKVIAHAGHGGKEFQTPEVKQFVLDFFSKTLKDQ